MTSRWTEPAPLPPCPSACVLQPGHPWEFEVDGAPARYHQGPVLEPFFGFELEVAERGVVERGVVLDPEQHDLDAAALDALGERARAAAAWLRSFSIDDEGSTPG